MYGVLRVRGEINVSHDIKETLAFMRLHSVNHFVVLKENDSTKGMLHKVKDYVTWGSIDEETFAKVLEKRARLRGDKKLDTKELKEKKLESYDKLAKEILSGSKQLGDYGIKPVFRLRPPRKGFERKGIKKPYSVGGSLGQRNNINALVMKMI